MACRRVGRIAACSGLIAACIAPGAPVRADLDPMLLARRIAAVGPRVPGTAEHGKAVEILLETMHRAGLEEVAATAVSADPSLRLLQGALPGESGLEIVLTAHFDTVAGSPGAADNAAGCAVLLAATAKLAELPRRHGVRVLLFDGEEAGQLGSSAWVSSLAEEEKAGILGAVNLDLVGWDGRSTGVVLTLAADDGRRRRVAPGWLVAAALAASRSVERPLAVGARSAGPLPQLLMRSLVLRHSSDAETLITGGVPAVTLSDQGLFGTDPENHRPGDTADRLDAVSLERWVDRVGALVLRLDALAGRPRDDDQYLALWHRVWSRRDLYWTAIAVWAALVFRGLPGGWRRGPLKGRRRGRSFLAGFALRFLFLGSVLILPVFSVLLLVPAAVLCLLPVGRWLTPRGKLTLACGPLLLALVALVWLTGQGQVLGVAVGPPALVLLAATFGSLVWSIAAEGPANAQPAHARSASVETADTHSSAEL